MMPIIPIKIRFDTIPPCKEIHLVRFDSFPNRVNSSLLPNRPDVRSLLPFLQRNRFDSFRPGDLPQVFANRFTVAALRTVFVRNRFNLLRISGTGGMIPGRFDTIVPKNAVFLNGWDALNDFPEGVGLFAFRYDTNWSYTWKTPNRFQIISEFVARICRTRWPSRYHADHGGTGFQAIRFDISPQDFLTYFRNRFDAVGTGSTLFPARKQAFVKPGWRILAKDLLTNEVHDLGFINAESENHAIENVSLPDGDYEISVLTSSLFWKDTLDTTIRTISIRHGEEISPLPTVYNLRSSISQGETTIYWSANRSDVSDCVFGVWYSQASPVSTDGPPNSVVWYSPDLTEYQTSFSQKAPCYVAVAAMRTGDSTEIGPVKELFLDWKSTPPRCPDDIVVLDSPLPVYDPDIFTLHQEEPDLALWS